ncbi:hypothetical protein PRUPE_7G095900 [Prunus persica]|uniref:Uncharacterized protein n=2 Tax=Prunus persica TaxID=3760 RepID=A0A251N9B1_PRUPE|nr:UPF0481 protein At3g47200 [Prunus persica]ONH95916.1 hypothetical protein PRUPE_7G095900 [Prunus persica]ONH95917.1 hypothetical protein PRUPE_7G095900 [Prunus persica]
MFQPKPEKGTSAFHGEIGHGNMLDGAGFSPTEEEEEEETSSTNAAPAVIVEKPRDEVAILIEGKVRDTPSFWPDCCIYKVPQRFRRGNEEFYEPRVVSIGPYHFHQGSFPQMQIFKLKYLEAFLSRNELSLDQCLGRVRTWEAKARRFYVDLIDLSSDEFAELMLVDAIFVLELMIRHQFFEYVDNCDRIYRKPRMIEDVFHDVLLIENQIPFFVLEGLYDLVDNSSKGTLKFFVELTHEFFKASVKINEFGADRAPVPGVNHGVKHFVDFIRCYYLPTEDEKHEYGHRFYEIPPSVTALEDAGVKFATTSTRSLLDIQFNRGCLKIPNFRVDDWTETVFRNLIALEQCHDDHQVKYISELMFLMGCMIKTSKDVDLLIEHEIISSMLGSNVDVSTLFNHIGQGVGLGQPYYYFSLCKKLNAYCKTPWHRWKPILQCDYFNTPWKVVSTIAAIVLLVLTLVQTICSILSL